MPSSILFGLAPFEKLFHTCFVQLLVHEHRKLLPRSAIYIFLSYVIEQKGYRCYDPKVNQLRILRHVTLLEHISFYSLPALSDSPDQPSLISIDPFPIAPASPATPFFVYSWRQQTQVPTIQTPDNAPLTLAFEPDISHRHPLHIRKPIERYGFVSSQLFSVYFTYLAFVHSHREPWPYKEASTVPDGIRP